MKKTIVLFTLLLLLSVSFVAFGEVLNFKLADGKEIKGEVVSVDKETITVKEWLGSRGYEKRERVFKWIEIDEEFRGVLKAKYGIPVDDGTGDSAYMVWGKTLHTATGRDYTGIVAEDESTDTKLVIYTIEKNRRRVAKNLITSEEKILIDMRKCFSPTKIYHLHVQENFPISARDHIELAEYCESIGAIRQAIKHYKKAQEKDDRYTKTNKISTKVTELETEYNEVFAQNLLDDANERLEKKDYKEASNLITRILENYGDTGAALEAQKLEKSIQEQVNLILARDIVAEYYDLIDKLIKKRVTGKVLDGESRPGFKVVHIRGTVEGILCDENGKAVPPPSTNETDFDEGEDDDFEDDSLDDYVYIRDDRGVIEIPRSAIKSMEPTELNKNTKKPTFMEDQKPYLSGRDPQLNKDIRSQLSFKYGISEKEIKDMWANRALEKRSFDNKIIRKSLAEKIKVNYGKGTLFSPKVKNMVRFNGRKGLLVQVSVGKTMNEIFDALSNAEKINVLKGIYAENALEVDTDSIKATVCSTCKGDGKGKVVEEKIPVGAGGTGGAGGGGRSTTKKTEGCRGCNGVGAYLSFYAR